MSFLFWGRSVSFRSDRLQVQLFVMADNSVIAQQGVELLLASSTIFGPLAPSLEPPMSSNIHRGCGKRPLRQCIYKDRLSGAQALKDVFAS